MIANTCGVKREREREREETADRWWKQWHMEGHEILRAHDICPGMWRRARLHSMIGHTMRRQSRHV
eukprot:12891582-Prorocentrum_lima.AAC.1